MRSVLLLLSASLLGCAPFPQLDPMGPDTGPPPQLAPIDELLAQAGPQAADPGPDVLARAAGLRDRAAGISVAAPAP